MMNKKVAVLWGTLALVGFIAAAGMAYGWLTDRTEAPDSLHVADTREDTANIYEDDLIEDTVNIYDDGLIEDTANTYDDSLIEDTLDSDALVIPQAPDFVMYDMYGNRQYLSDFFGKPIVLNFWATWCPNCVVEMPYFQQLYEELGNEIHILKINLLDGQRETREMVDQFIADHGLSFPIYFDAGDGAFEYGVSFIPMTFFIDADGYAIASSQGAVDSDILRRGLETVGVLW